jgi:methyl-accepting chemotaxis protein
LSLLASHLPIKSAGLTACLSMAGFGIPFFVPSLEGGILAFAGLGVVSFAVAHLFLKKQLQPATEFLLRMNKDRPDEKSFDDYYTDLCDIRTYEKQWRELFENLSCLVLELDEYDCVTQMYGHHGLLDHVVHLEGAGLDHLTLPTRDETKDLSGQDWQKKLVGQKLTKIISKRDKEGFLRQQAGRHYLVGYCQPYHKGSLVCLMMDPGLKEKMNLDVQPEMVRHISQDLAQLLEDIRSYAAALEQSLKAMAEGDFTRQVKAGKGIFRSLSQHVNDALGSLSEMISHLDMDLKALNADLDMTGDEAVNLTERFQRQSTALQQTATTMEELSSTVQSNAENATKASTLAAEARESALSGGQTVKAALEAMERIEDSSSRITQIISLIDDVAFQTNLLALNAAVEAARAGEAGKGFAVVAAEVRTLAQRAGQASREIKTLIESTQERVSEGVTLVRKTEIELVDVGHSIGTLDQIMAEIAAATRQQAIGISEVTTSVSHMETVTTQTADSIETMAQTLHQSRQKIGRLKDWMMTCKVHAPHPANGQGLAKIFHHVTSAEQSSQARTNYLSRDSQRTGFQSDENSSPASIHQQKAYLSRHFRSSPERPEPLRTSYSQSEVRSVSPETVAKFLDNQEEWEEF